MKKVLISAAIAGGVMMIIWSAAWILLVNGFEKWEERGQFGDMFGSVNALFSSLALVGVIAAILIQKEELELQRRELEMTRDELTRSAYAQEKSSEALTEQLKNQTKASQINGYSALLSSANTQLASFTALLKSIKDIQEDGSKPTGWGWSERMVFEQQMKNLSDKITTYTEEISQLLIIDSSTTQASKESSSDSGAAI